MKSVWRKMIWMAAGGALVAACGVKSSPQAPADATFPRQYPTPLPALETTAQPAEERRPAPVVADPKGFWQYPNTPPQN